MRKVWFVTLNSFQDESLSLFMFPQKDLISKKSPSSKFKLWNSDPSKVFMSFNRRYDGGLNDNKKQKTIYNFHS
jgi:hypothetical protein